MAFPLFAGRARNIGRRWVAVFVACAAAALVAALPAQAQTFTVLYSFKGRPADGSGPNGTLIRDAAGNLYGTTSLGGRFGSSGFGTVFELNTAGNERPLYVFGKNPGDGKNPLSGVTMDSMGNLYGTTVNGGASGNGSVYKLSQQGLTILYSFAGGQTDGANPVSNLVRDCCGNLYGTTENGGLGNNKGTVFRINKNGGETLLHTFWGGDGAEPGSLLGAGAGIFYGTTVNSGTGVGASKFGTIYKIDSTGKETVLYRFQGKPDGQFPPGGLAMDSSGNLYGTTVKGGAFGFGTVFKLDSNANETVLYSFTGEIDGAGPQGGLVLDNAGNLYGTTPNGGDASCQCGVVFKLDPNGNETVLHTFLGSDGSSPEGTLLLDPSGNLYGTTPQGGAYEFGTIFKIGPVGPDAKR